MNPQAHRIIFNRSRGQFMAVGENARSCASRGSTGRSRRRCRRVAPGVRAGQAAAINAALSNFSTAVAARPKVTQVNATLNGKPLVPSVVLKATGYNTLTFGGSLGLASSQLFRAPANTKPSSK